MYNGSVALRFWCAHQRVKSRLRVSKSRQCVAMLLCTLSLRQIKHFGMICARLSMSAWYRSAIPDERETSCGGREYKREAAIFVDACPCHTIFVSYDDWWPRVLRRCAACLEHFAIQRHCVWHTRHLQSSSENASFCHVIPLIFTNCAHRILFCILTLKTVLGVIFRLLNDTLIIFVLIIISTLYSIVCIKYATDYSGPLHVVTYSLSLKPKTERKLNLKDHYRS